MVAVKFAIHALSLLVWHQEGHPACRSLTQQFHGIS